MHSQNLRSGESGPEPHPSFIGFPCGAAALSPRAGVEEAVGSLHIDGCPWTEGQAKLSLSLMAAADCAFRSSWEASRLRGRSGRVREKWDRRSAARGQIVEPHLVRPEPMTRQPRPVRRLLVLLDPRWAR